MRYLVIFGDGVHGHLVFRPEEENSGMAEQAVADMIKNLLANYQNFHVYKIQEEEG